MEKKRKRDGMIYDWSDNILINDNQVSPSENPIMSNTDAGTEYNRMRYCYEGNITCESDFAENKLKRRTKKTKKKKKKKVGRGSSTSKNEGVRSQESTASDPLDMEELIESMKRGTNEEMKILCEENVTDNLFNSEGNEVSEEFIKKVSDKVNLSSFLLMRNETQKSKSNDNSDLMEKCKFNEVDRRSYIKENEEKHKQDKLNTIKRMKDKITTLEPKSRRMLSRYDNLSTDTIINDYLTGIYGDNIPNGLLETYLHYFVSLQQLDDEHCHYLSSILDEKSIRNTLRYKNISDVQNTEFIQEEQWSYDHDVSQLVEPHEEIINVQGTCVKRRTRPCIKGTDCCIQSTRINIKGSIGANQRVLQEAMSPTEYATFLKTGEYPERHHMCVLCLHMEVVTCWVIIRRHRIKGNISKFTLNNFTNAYGYEGAYEEFYMIQQTNDKYDGLVGAVWIPIMDKMFGYIDDHKLFRLDISGLLYNPDVHKIIEDSGKLKPFLA